MVHKKSPVEVKKTPSRFGPVDPSVIVSKSRTYGVDTGARFLMFNAVVVLLLASESPVKLTVPVIL